MFILVSVCQILAEVDFGQAPEMTSKCRNRVECVRIVLRSEVISTADPRLRAHHTMGLAGQERLETQAAYRGHVANSL